MMKKNTLAGIFFVTILGILSIFGYETYRENSAKEAAQPAVKLASAYLSQFINYERESTNITYIEYFRKAEGAINELDKKEIELRSMTTSKNKALYQEAADYIRLSQSLIRELANSYRNSLELRALSASADRSVKRAMSASVGTYESELATNKASVSLNDAEKHLSKSKQTLRNITSFAKEIQKKSDSLGKTFGEDSLIEKAVLDALIENTTAQN